MAGSIFPQFPIFKSGLSEGFNVNKRINPLMAPENPPTIEELSSAPGLNTNQLNPPSLKTTLLSTEPRKVPPPITELNNTPRHTKSYLEFLETEEPRKKEHQLSTLGKILATGAGAAEGWNRGVGSGVNVGLELLDRPYQEAIHKYERRGGRLKELAGVEQSLLGEAEKQRVKQVELELAMGKDARENALANNTFRLGDSTISLNNERMKDLQDQAKVRGLIWQKKEETGEGGFVDPRTNQWISAGKFYETITDKAKRERDLWDHQERTRQNNAIYLHNLDNDARRGLEEFKEGLFRGRPEQKQKLTEAAFGETLLMNPDLREKLFTLDDKGNWIPKNSDELDEIDPVSKRPFRDYQGLFNDKLKQRMNAYGANEEVSNPMVRPKDIVDIPRELQATQQRVIEWNNTHGPDQQMDPNSLETLKGAQEVFNRQDASDKKEGLDRGDQIRKQKFGSTTNPILANMGWTGTLPVDPSKISNTTPLISPNNPFIPGQGNWSGGNNQPNQPMIPQNNQGPFMGGGNPQLANMDYGAQLQQSPASILPGAHIGPDNSPLPKNFTGAPDQPMIPQGPQNQAGPFVGNLPPQPTLQQVPGISASDYFASTQAPMPPNMGNYMQHMTPEELMAMQYRMRGMSLLPSSRAKAGY